MTRVDHAELSGKFISDEKHIQFHDKRLWTLRTLRDEAAYGIEEWEELRTLASGIKEHALTHLADYLEEFEKNATRNGVIVHWAKDAEEHNRIVHYILSSHNARSLVKSKSMLTEECQMREFQTTNAAIGNLPRAFIYNPFNAWGKQREVPDAPEYTFRDWYLNKRKSK